MRIMLRRSELLFRRVKRIPMKNSDASCQPPSDEAELHARNGPSDETHQRQPESGDGAGGRSCGGITAQGSAQPETLRRVRWWGGGACKQAVQEEDNIIPRDSYDGGHHILCDRFPSQHVGEGKRFCDFLSLKAIVERIVQPQTLIDALCKPSHTPTHARTNLWQLRSLHSLASYSLHAHDSLHAHVPELYLALVCVLDEEVGELNRRNKLNATTPLYYQKEQAAQEQQLTQQVDHRELLVCMDSLFKKVLPNVRTDAEEVKELAHFAKGRAPRLAQNERLAKVQDRLTTEVAACLKSLLATVLADRPNQLPDNMPIVRRKRRFGQSALSQGDRRESSSGRLSPWKPIPAGAEVAIQQTKRRGSELQANPYVWLRMRHPKDSDETSVRMRLHDLSSLPASLPPSPPGSPVAGAAAPPVEAHALLPLPEAAFVVPAAIDSAPSSDDVLAPNAEAATNLQTIPAFVVGMAVESSSNEAGMRGSWYTGTILSIAAQTAIVAFSALHDSLREDSPLHEQISLNALRPIPPLADSGFARGLQPGMLAEAWWQQGWWQVVVKHKPSDAPSVAAAAGSSSADASVLANEWSLESVHYGNCHRLQEPVLRPCWCWDPCTHKWSIKERVPAAPALPALAEPPGPSPKPASVDKEKYSKRKSEISPGLKELQREESEREMRELLELYAPGSHVEVRGLDEGFLGSWYQCQVLEAREARSTIRLRVRYLAFQEEDGSFWEDWFDQQNVRPMPPDHDPSFILELKKGQPLEIDIEEGWWEVELSGRDGPNYLVTAKRYKVQHIVPLERLRPAWGWSQRERAWSELKTRPLQVVNEGSSKSSAKTSSSNKKRLGV